MLKLHLAHVVPSTRAKSTFLTQGYWLHLFLYGCGYNARRPESHEVGTPQREECVDSLSKSKGQSCPPLDPAEH